MKKRITFLIVLLLVNTLSFSQTDNEIQGDNAGVSNTTGSYNVIYGDNTGVSLTIGSYNTLIGGQSGNQIVDANYQTLIGYQAGFSNVSARDNTMVGFRSGYYNQSGTDNTFLGNGSGFNNTSGLDNTYIGKQAGYRFTTGTDNTFIGDDAGAGLYSFNDTTVATTSPATGSDNTAVGSAAGFRLKTGYRNTFVGADAGYDVEDGYRNTFVGDSTGIDLKNGRLNTMIGQSAGSGTEHASYSTFIGANAGADVNRANQTDGSSNRNTYVGAFTGFANRQGTDNVGMGAFSDVIIHTADALQNATGRDAGGYGIATLREKNTFIGAQSYANNNEVVLLGYKARVDGLGAIAIGSQARAQGNYSVALGYGVNVTNTNTMALGGNTTTNRLSVGIGTVAANQNASLDLADTDKGFLVNRMTTAQRTAMITAPASGVALTTTDAGLMVYDTDDKVFYFWNGTQWNELGKTNIAGSGTNAVPELLNYQSVIRDAAGVILSNQPVSFRMNIKDATTGNTTVYSETHTVTTSSQGLVNFTIGSGTIVSGLFSDIDWSHNNSLQIELDAAGGTTYVAIGTTSFVSVPYALRAKYAENLTNATSAKMSSSNDKDARIDALESEVKALKKLVHQLISKK